jgi:soluble lytic murein transglycosylase-like protein
MSMKQIIYSSAIACIAIVSILLFNNKIVSANSTVHIFNDTIDSSTTLKSSIASVQMYYYIKKYANEYEIPESYAFGIAYQETKYQGPLHFKYKPDLISYAGAVGPMQIMPSTADGLCKRTVNVQRLKSDIEFNVMLSMKLLRRLHDRYNNWGLVFGAYNTGRPCVNQYALNVLNKNFLWITN